LQYEVRTFLPLSGFLVNRVTTFLPIMGERCGRAHVRWCGCCNPMVGCLACFYSPVDQAACCYVYPFLQLLITTHSSDIAFVVRQSLRIRP